MSGNRISRAPISKEDAANATRYSYNDHEGSITVNGFIVSAVGRKVVIGAVGAVETYTFSENGVTLYVLTLTYTDASKTTLVSAERTA